MSKDEVKLSVSGLTDRQLQCLQGYWNRRPAKLIAADLGISEAGVHKNLSAARRKLHVTSSADAAAIVFGAKPGGIKSYYYRETDLPEIETDADEPGASVSSSLALAISERPLINQLGPLATVAGIVLVALISIVGVTLTIDAGEGLYQLLRALGY